MQNALKIKQKGELMMDDGSVGVSSSETAESSAEATAENASSESVAETTISEAETSAAFDENNDTVIEIKHEVPECADDASKEATDGESANEIETITSNELDSAFDEVQTEKTNLTEESKSESALTGSQIEAEEAILPEKTDTADVIHVICKRDDLAGMEHPETGVPYETKIVEVNGQKLEVTVPQFESNFDMKLDSDQLLLSRQKHEVICNAKLKECCEENPDWAKETFSQKQLEQIKNGVTPENYTWHHDGGEVGHMQLVDSKTHYNTRHTGGIAIWGCTSKYI